MDKITEHESAKIIQALDSKQEDQEILIPCKHFSESYFPAIKSDIIKVFSEFSIHLLRENINSGTLSVLDIDNKTIKEKMATVVIKFKSSSFVVEDIFNAIARSLCKKDEIDYSMYAGFMIKNKEKKELVRE